MVKSEDPNVNEEKEEPVWWVSQVGIIEIDQSSRSCLCGETGSCRVRSKPQSATP